jgi:hypothetical protein
LPTWDRLSKPPLPLPRFSQTSALREAPRIMDYPVLLTRPVDQRRQLVLRNGGFAWCV